MPSQRYLFIRRGSTGKQELVGGFMIVSAESYERAVQVAREMPGMMPGASIEVREIAS